MRLSRPMPEPLRSESLFGKLPLEILQIILPCDNVTEISINDSPEGFIPCLKAFSISDMNKSGATIARSPTSCCGRERLTFTFLPVRSIIRRT